MPKHLHFPSISLATTIPPELLSKIVHLAGEEALLYDEDDDGDNEPNALYFADRRGGMRHLSSCSLTCVYWAKVARPRMYRILVLRCVQDIYDLLSLLHASHAHLGTRGIPSISQCLQHLVVEHELGNWVWFHNILQLLKIQVEHQRYTSLRLDVHVDGHNFPSKKRAKSRPALHPLFLSMPRPIPIPPLSYKSMRLTLQDTALANISELRNLVQDFNLKSAEWHKEEEWILTRAWSWYTDKIYCKNVTWGSDSSPKDHSDIVSSADLTTIIVDVHGAELPGPSALSSGCTDNVATAMDCTISALRCANRSIRFVRIERYDVIVGMLQSLRDSALKSGLCERNDVKMEGSWRYDQQTSHFDTELDFIVEMTPSPPNLLNHSLGIHSIRFDTVSQNTLIGPDDIHDVHQVHIRLHDPSMAATAQAWDSAYEHDLKTIIASFHCFSQVTKITLSSSKRNTLLDFTRRFKATLISVKDILVLSYTGEPGNGGGGVIQWESSETID